MKYEEAVIFTVSTPHKTPLQSFEILTLTAFNRLDTEETLSLEGTGLSLVIAKSIVDIHGGHMEINSEIGVGT